METGTGIFLGALFVGSVALFGVTKDRWKWKRIAAWFGGVVGLASLGAAGWLWYLLSPSNTKTAAVEPVDAPYTAWSREASELARKHVEISLAAQKLGAPERSFKDSQERAKHLEWLSDMSRRLTTHMPDLRTRGKFIKVLDYEAARAGLDRQLVFALIEASSGFQVDFTSPTGARGYMAVLPAWTDRIGDGDEAIARCASKPAIRNSSSEALS